MKRFLLFDVDMTLIDSGGAGIAALNRAMEELFGISEGFKNVKAAGKTDPQIVREALTNHGFDDDSFTIHLFTDLYLIHLQDTLGNGKGHVKPGVFELLRRLEEDSEFLLGLLTGNLEAGARLKLGRFSLNRYFPVGAFGNDDEDRNGLLPIAVQRLGLTTGVRLDYRDCVVIGDTPLDVACAAAHGAPCIAVATGPYSVDVLAETGAALVLEDLSDTDRVLSWLRSR
jgi:phosphoglycolate phosphatase